MKKIISSILSAILILSALPMQSAFVLASEISVEGITTTDEALTNQYMMNSGLKTENNLLYKAIPKRIYTKSDSYTTEKDYIKYSKNTGSNGVNAYTFIGNNTDIQSKYANFLELTNGEINITKDNDLYLDETIWNRSNSNQYLGLEYDLGGDVTLDKFYVCWTNTTTAGYERICRGYELYASSQLDTLYSQDSLVYSVDDNQNSINVVTLPENTVGRYFAIRITKCDNGVPSSYVYPRCKELALTGTRNTENYAICSGLPVAVTIGTDTLKYWMNDTPATDPENIIKGISPISTTYTDATGTTPATSSKFVNFTDGYFNDSYVSGYFQGDTYMNDNTYEDIVWDFGESKTFWEAWLAFRTEIDGNPFYATKYQLYVADDSATIFNTEPIITVDGNAQNVNRISFNKRTGRYFGIRVIVPNSDISYGASNLRVSIMELSLVGEAKRTIDVSAKSSEGETLDIEIDGASDENYTGQPIELKAPARVTVGKKAYIFDSFTVDGKTVESTADDECYKISVNIEKGRKVEAIYKRCYLVSYNALIVKGGASETISDFKEPVSMTKGEVYNLASDLTITIDDVQYKLSSWDINGEVISATDDGKYSYEVTDNTTVTAIYTAGGNEEYLAIFTDNSNSQVGIYSIPKGTAVSEIVTSEILSNLNSGKLFGYTFTGEWSQSLDAVYDTTVHFKSIYVQNSETYDVVINGITTKARFDEKVNLVAQNEKFSSWIHGDSVISTEPDCYIYSPGNITIKENTFGSGTEVTDYVAVVNFNPWDFTDDTYTATVTANINGISAENFVSCGILFTSTATINIAGTGWDNKFKLGEINTIYKDLTSYPDGGCYMISLQGININNSRYARAYVKHTVNGSTITSYSKTIIKLSAEGINMPEQRKTNVIKDYENHPMLPLYGDNSIPYYNETFANKIVAGSSNGNGSQTDNNPTITPYLVEGAKKCVVIFPGGGYYQRSDTSEGINIAKKYNENGFSAFVVRYRVGNDSSPSEGYNLNAILSDGQRAVQYVRYNAKEFGIDPDKVAVCGFSAGGHLSMMVSQNEHESNVVGDRIGEISNIPNATILSYAVTTLQTGTFGTMPPILSGNNSSIQTEINQKYSGELNVTSKTPATFIWCGEADTAVNPQYNSKAYYDALQKAGVYSELYTYQGIGHGVGLATNTVAEAWHSLSVTFLNNILK